MSTRLRGTASTATQSCRLGSAEAVKLQRYGEDDDFSYAGEKTSDKFTDVLRKRKRTQAERLAQTVQSLREVVSTSLTCVWLPLDWASALVNRNCNSLARNSDRSSSRRVSCIARDYSKVLICPDHISLRAHDLCAEGRSSNGI
jgi:hypothetical protein